MIQGICEAFCDAITHKQVPLGYAITTPFRLSDGDPIVFFVIKDGPSNYHIEDDGTQVPLLEASGVDLSTGSRADLFRELLSEYGLSYDDNARALRTAELAESDVPTAALNFIAALLRVQDFMLSHPVIVRNTFREDAITAIHSEFDTKVSVTEDAVISDRVPGFKADVLFSSAGISPVAIFIGTSNERALIALVVKMETEKYQIQPCRVILLVERSKKNPIEEDAYSLAHARLDSVLAFRGVERDTMARIGEYLQ